MGNSNESDWGKIVLVSMIILAVIFIFKIIFVLSIIAIFIGAVWLYFDRENNIPLIIVIAGIVLAPISYYIGYQFEQSEIGKPIVDSVKTIVNTDNQIKESIQNITNNVNDITAKSVIQK